MSPEFFPPFHACLNSITFFLLLYGYYLIKKGRRDCHRKVMFGALLISSVFLISYLYYHYQVGSVRYEGKGVLRVIYFAILISHTLLAMIVPFGAIRLVFLGVKQRFAEHKKLAKYIFPIWTYVSFTGVVIYWMLYR